MGKYPVIQSQRNLGKASRPWIDYLAHGSYMLQHWRFAGDGPLTSLPRLYRHKIDYSQTAQKADAFVEVEGDARVSTHIGQLSSFQRTITSKTRNFNSD
jgi:hypothetical protein